MVGHNCYVYSWILSQYHLDLPQVLIFLLFKVNLLVFYVSIGAAVTQHCVGSSVAQ